MDQKKPSFEDYVQKWIAVDNELSMLNEKSKTMKEWKQKLTTVIVQAMVEKDLTANTLEVGDGTVRYHEKKEYSGITFGYIEKCLHEILADDESVTYVVQYLKDKRELKYVPELKRRKYCDAEDD